MLELLFVGAGPHSLATLTRLLEPNPDPGVDAPQRHVNAKAKVLSYWQWQRTCPTYRAALTDWLQTHVAVVDPSGDWMTRWHQQFSALGISHLRSTTAVHPDPLDSYALATYASAANRTSELLPLEHIEKSREFVGPFAVPGTKLFEDFCKDLVHRYCLDGLVMQDKVLDLTPVFTNLHSSTTPSVDHWQILLASGRQLTAKQVVLAVGSTNKPRVPEAFQHLQAVPILSPRFTTPGSCSKDAASAVPSLVASSCSNGVVSASTAINPRSCSSDMGRATPSLTSCSATVGASPRPSPDSCSSGSVSASPLPGASSGSSGSGSFSMLLGAPAVQDQPELQCSSLPAADSSCTSDSVTLADNKQATGSSGSSGSSGSNAESECCSGSCDGACSNSSGWSSDSMVSAAAGGSGTATATAAAATATPGTAAAAAEMGAAAVDKPAAATVGSRSLTAVPGSQPAPTVGAACRDSSSTCSSSVSSVSSPGSICDSLDNWVLVDRTVPDAESAAQPCGKPVPLEVFRDLHSRHVQDNLSEPQSASSSSSSTVFNSNLSASSSSSLELLDGPRPSTVGVAAGTAAAGQITEPAGAAAEGVAVALGPCSWVSTCSSPTDGCDSLCSWLGCEHTAAAAAAATAAALAGMGDPITTPPNSSSSSSLGSAVLAASAETASSVTSADDRCSPAAAAGTYPWGRLIHAWQLVEALTTGSSSSSSGTAGLSHRTHSSDCHGTNCDSCSGSVVGTSGTSRHSQKSAGKGRRWGKRTSSSSSKIQQDSKAAGSTATARSAMLLQQQGLLMPGESVMIVGGGLTTAHLAALAAAAAAAGGGSTANAASPMAGSSDSSSSKAGQMPVSLLLRGGLRVKQFDVDIEYMGRNRGSTLQFGFRQLGNFEERLALMKRVLQGGSVTPEAAAVLSELRKRGVLEVHEHSEVLDASWDWEHQRWDVWLQDGTLMHADRLWLATGSALSAQADPLLSKLLQKLPMPLVAGLPTLQPTLEWSPNSGMYVLGAYAALQLGPGALNLAGAKTGSVIVGQQLNDVLPELPRVAECGGSSGAVRQRGKSVKGK